MKVGEVIVNLRKQKAVKQKDLAKALGISATYLSLIEHEQSKPSIDLIAKVAEYFDLPVSAIFFKAIDVGKIKDKKQKKYFETAEPLVNDIINYLLSGDDKKKWKASLPKIKHNINKRVKA